MDEIAGFPIHRGILACARKGSALRLQDLMSDQDQPARLLVLNQLSNHDNVGAAFRNAAAFGVDGVLLDRAILRSRSTAKPFASRPAASLWLPYPSWRYRPVEHMSTR